MAVATLDEDYKDELSVIEQYFRILSHGEKTASLYALAQQITPAQIGFFLLVLRQMEKNHSMFH
ncbi:hypothetical protein BKA65DRAFT_412233 [Rhexocercosporidium sp. MPI-PUGE-AT-0058]|nr:hypothetical protein BKA65DRAFT_412233 [Rhexocercosporidium sp. MPI-PUGE-AT-0058]